MSTLLCFHTSKQKYHKLDPTMCTASSMDAYNGGLPGLYFSCLPSSIFTKPDEIATGISLVKSRQKRYGKFLNQFVLDTRSPHFIMSKRTIIRTSFDAMNHVGNFASVNSADELWKVLDKSSKTDKEFLVNLIKVTRITDVKYWVNVIGSVADFIYTDDNIPFPGDGVCFKEVYPKQIVTL